MRVFVVPSCVLALRAADAAGTGTVPPIVSRFLSREEPSLVSVRARRHLEANNPKFKKQSWIDAVTLSDACAASASFPRRSKRSSGGLTVVPCADEEEFTRTRPD